MQEVRVGDGTSAGKLRPISIIIDLVGVENVRLSHDQALFKEPGGGHTLGHQDKFYWPLDTDKMITIWMPLVD